MAKKDTRSTEEKRHAFAAEYAASSDAIAAAKAYGVRKGTEESMGKSLLESQGMRALINALKYAPRGGLISPSREAVLNELSLVAFSDITNYRFTGSGSVGAVEGVDPSALRAVQRVKWNPTNGAWEVQVWNKLDALKMLAAHFSGDDSMGSVDEYMAKVYRVRPAPKSELDDEGESDGEG